MDSSCPHNKPADCLSWLVDVKDTPATATASINMLVTSTLDGPTTHTHSKRHNTANTTTSTDTTATTTNEKVNTSPPLTEDRKDTVGLLQRVDPFCKHISKRLLSGKAPLHEINTFTHIKGLIYKHIMDSNQRFLALVITKSWHFTVLVEAHDKLGHQGINRTYRLVKCHYTGKAWTRILSNTSIIVHCVKGKRQWHRYTPYRWQIYLIDPLTK